MNKYLPSKKFIYTLGSIVLALLIIISTGKFLAGRQISIKNEDSRKVTFEKFMEVDSDGDGLKDWEESLWKTDPKQKDTDGDGTSDGEEVVAKRDPLKKAPGDEIDPKIIAKQEKIETEFKELSQTEQLSRVLFSQYIAAKGNGALNETDKKIILETAESNIINAPTTKYTLSDITIGNTLSSTTRHNYGNELGFTFFTGSTQEKVENEMVVLDRVIKSNNEKDLAGLDPIIEGYEKTINKILKMSIPSDVVDAHLNFLNDLVGIKSGLSKMKKMFTDPAAAITGLKEYQVATNDVMGDLLALKNYFIKNKVYYTNKEYGYIFLNII